MRNTIAWALPVCIFALLVHTEATAPGWKMTDRFAGFRFELHGSFEVASFMKDIVDKADALAGFGWIQYDKAHERIGGEFRGNKRTGPQMQKWLKKGPGAADYQATFHEYIDTKIRYHFSHFKVVDEDREMCFESAPYGCAVAAAGDDSAEL